ncbi:WecB/TagA/CpsF family glycosyltransferase [Maricaulis sp.]|uniref:WecB/TagA/CpsF family glycosyltransferase n=1 Tax=Maricaulis sp. TaxID=1486257 RepID=UPI001B0DDEED|nr:WecB/TagA/CpsF family glycosyltransferase [Maricaulis sp.]MBO6798553.1 WecB/TagA/CpsF family glycosyltransferase [Maricaulis sp.]
MVDLPLTASDESLASIAAFKPQTTTFCQPTREEVGPTTDVLGLQLLTLSQSETIDLLIERLNHRAKTRIAFLNAHCANVASTDWQYRQALESCTLVLPDGIGIEMASRLGGDPIKHDLNGTDLFPKLCDALRDADKSVFFLGGRPGIAEATAQAAVKTCPGLRIAGTQHGYFGPQDETAIIDQINVARPDVVLVAMGVPVQDTWLARVGARINAPLLAGVGGLFDFVSGATPRAPAWVRKTRLEWAYRLIQEPRRMWKRYLLGNIAFVARALAHGWKRRSAARRKTLSLALKRALDLCASALAITALSPVLLLTALSIRLESRGPVLFRQQRVGEDGTTFEMFKFRSMYTDAEARLDQLLQANDRNDGVTFKLKHDPRVTGIGRWIRKYSIDELPQLFNVWRGDMSLVGPRPALQREVERYSALDRERLCGKPGITGIWQVSGRADIPFQKMVEMDVRYLKTRTLITDLVILARTPLAVVSARGAY